MTTFSQLVDSIVTETRRPDLRKMVADYLNQTIRECHFRPDNNQSVGYRANLQEALVESDKETGLGWNIPDPALFQAMQTVRFDSINCRDDLTRYPPERMPGRGLVGLERYYYRAGQQFYFAGFGGLGARISIAYFEYPRQLKYYEEGLRPAEFDIDMGWTYAEPFSATPELQAAAQRFCTNWLLQKWDIVIAEGLRAKVYKRLSDTDRARTAFSLYTQLRMGLLTGESMSPGGFG